MEHVKVDVHSIAKEENYRSTSSEACIINRAADLVRETLKPHISSNVEKIWFCIESCSLHFSKC